jgi:hypothetical protein
MLGGGMHDWRLDITRWPGPDRRKWPGLRDEIHESPDGGYAAVVYSCGEVGVDKQVGLFALLSGPPDSPRLVLRPRNLWCLVRYDDTTVRWLGNRYCVVTPRRGGRHRAARTNRPTRSSQSIGALYIDLETRKAAFFAGDTSGALGSVPPDGLAWQGWEQLARASSLQLWLGSLVTFCAGLAIAWMDTRSNWDDTGLTAGALLIAAAAGSLIGLPPWLSALLAAGPILLAELPHGTGVLLAVPFVLAGAFAAAFVRRRASAR